jgi:hypothetical protein
MVRSAVVVALALAMGGACAGNLDTTFVKYNDLGGGGDTGGGGTGGGGAGGGAVPSCNAQAVITQKCVAGCHTPNNDSAAGLNLTWDDGLPARLLGVASAGAANSACGGMIYLNPSQNPATGLFIDKLVGPSCGDQMPPLPFSATSLQCLLDWATSISAP